MIIVHNLWTKMKSISYNFNKSLFKTPPSPIIRIFKHHQFQNDIYNATNRITTLRYQTSQQHQHIVNYLEEKFTLRNLFNFF